MNMKSKGELLQELCECDPETVVQYDGWDDDTPQAGLQRVTTSALVPGRNGFLRVLIHPGANAETVISTLAKISADIKAEAERAGARGIAEAEATLKSYREAPLAIALRNLPMMTPDDDLPF